MNLFILSSAKLFGDDTDCRGLSEIVISWLTPDVYICAKGQTHCENSSADKERRKPCILQALTFLDSSTTEPSLMSSVISPNSRGHLEMTARTFSLLKERIDGLPGDKKIATVTPIDYLPNFRFHFTFRQNLRPNKTL